jgi:hypothetical protein
MTIRKATPITTSTLDSAAAKSITLATPIIIMAKKVASTGHDLQSSKDSCQPPSSFECDTDQTAVNDFNFSVPTDSSAQLSESSTALLRYRSSSSSPSPPQTVSSKKTQIHSKLCPQSDHFITSTGDSLRSSSLAESIPQSVPQNARRPERDSTPMPTSALTQNDNENPYPPQSSKYPYSLNAYSHSHTSHQQQQQFHSSLNHSRTANNSMINSVLSNHPPKPSSSASFQTSTPSSSVPISPSIPSMPPHTVKPPQGALPPSPSDTHFNIVVEDATSNPSRFSHYQSPSTPHQPPPSQKPQPRRRIALDPSKTNPSSCAPRHRIPTHAIRHFFKSPIRTNPNSELVMTTTTATTTTSGTSAVLDSSNGVFSNPPFSSTAASNFTTSSSNGLDQPSPSPPQEQEQLQSSQSSTTSLHPSTFHDITIDEQSNVINSAAFPNPGIPSGVEGNEGEGGGGGGDGGEGGGRGGGDGGFHRPVQKKKRLFSKTLHVVGLAWVLACMIGIGVRFPSHFKLSLLVYD